MLAVNAASMNFFRVILCLLLFQKNSSVTSFTDDTLPEFFEKNQGVLDNCKGSYKL